jgi:phosphatidylserine/phosphatidylglycerophosphate/cardiolipin synthase-like enzyme
VKEAARLFECDSKRRPYTEGKADLVVSPVNARKRLSEFISGAKKRLLIYEMKISDRDILKLLNKKISDGVEVRVLSRGSSKNGTLPIRRIPLRMHLRAILRDSDSAFIGSQSMRKLELEARREIGMIFRDKEIVKEMEAIFEKDWKQSEPVVEQLESALPAKKVAREVAKQISIKPVVEQVIDKVIGNKQDATFDPEEVAQTVREAFQEEVQAAVAEALKEMAVKSEKDKREQAQNRKPD